VSEVGSDSDAGVFDSILVPSDEDNVTAGLVAIAESSGNVLERYTPSRPNTPHLPAGVHLDAKSSDDPQPGRSTHMQQSIIDLSELADSEDEDFLKAHRVLAQCNETIDLSSDN